MYCIAHVDDSSDGKREKYTLACALIGEGNQWSKFLILWEEGLNAEPSIEYFHAKEWRNRTGEFSQFNDKSRYPEPTGREAADRKRNTLKAIVEKSNLKAIVITVLLPDYEKIRNAYPSSHTYFGKNPFEVALQSLLYECGKEVRRFPEKSAIGFIFDENQDAVEHTRLYLEFKKKNPETAKVLAGIGHFDDRWNPGIQAADLVANVANMLFYDNPEGKPFAVPLPELGSTFYRICPFNEEYALEVLKANGVDIKENDGAKEKQS